MSLSSLRQEFVAVDDGYDHTKAVTRSKGVRIPTSYSLKPSAQVAVIAGGESAETVYEIEGVQYAVGPDVVSRDTRFEDFPYHPANLAVAMDAIRRVVEPGTPVHVIAGLPLNRFYLPSGEINAEVFNRKALAWNRHVRVIKGSALPRICKVSVISEAVAAWVDFVVSDDFVVNDHRINDFMAVADIGGRTINIAVFQNANVVLSLSGTIDRGVLDLHKRVENSLVGRFPGTQFPRSVLQEAAMLGQARLGATSVDISAELQEERRSLVSDIEIFMKSRFGNQLPLMRRVLFVGGGAQVLQFELRERFPKANFANDPQMANARGMLKYGVTIAGFDQVPAAVNA